MYVGLFFLSPLAMVFSPGVILLADRQVPSEEDGLRALGPIALHSPNGGNTPLPSDGFALDTEIPMLARSKRKRAVNCCLCCGVP